jgi:aromatic ring-opening dioxygenase LigB subunit
VELSETFVSPSGEIIQDMNACHALEDDGPFPYSLNLLPYDVHVFNSLRKTLKNCRFKLEEEGFKVC